MDTKQASRPEKNGTAIKYMTRNMPRRLHRRLKIAAAHTHSLTVEQVLNQALEWGLPLLEKEIGVGRR